MLFLYLPRERTAARREVERIRDADLQSSSSITAGSGPVTMPRAPPVGTALIVGTERRLGGGGGAEKRSLNDRRALYAWGAPLCPARVRRVAYTKWSVALRAAFSPSS